MSWSQIHWLGMSWSWIHWLGKLCMIKRLCRSECRFCLSKDLHCHRVVITLFPCNLFCHFAVTGFCMDLPSRSGVLRMQKLRSPLLRTQSYQRFPLMPGVGHNIQHIFAYSAAIRSFPVLPFRFISTFFSFFLSGVKWPMLWPESGTFACNVLHCVPPLDDLHGWQGTKHQEPINHGFTCVIIYR